MPVIWDDAAPAEQSRARLTEWRPTLVLFRCVLRFHVSLLDVNAKECSCCRVEMNIIWLLSATHATQSTGQPSTHSLADISTHTSTGQLRSDWACAGASNADGLGVVKGAVRGLP